MRKLLALTAGALALVISAIAVADHPARSQAARTIRVVLTVPPGGSWVMRKTLKHTRLMGIVVIGAAA